ncbi:MAG: protein kinase [Thermoanaerobaculia bacterium]
MDKEKEKKILLLALKNGIIEIEDLKISYEDLSKEKTIDSNFQEIGDTIKGLLARGKLKIQDLDSLIKQVEGKEEKKEEAVSFKENPKARYKLLELLGEGGMGKVYKAHDKKLNRYVALKFLKENNPEKQKRFLQEAQAQAKLKSDGICKIYEAGEMDGKPFISMQYIEGKNLREAAKEMNLEMKVNIIKKVAEGLQEAHKLGILHRDINPSNIMIEKDENGEYKPYIMDFGLAKEISEPSLTQDGMIMGTLYYMSPEQASGINQNLDRRSDIYSLGATLYEILTGEPPFTGGFGEVLEKVRKQEPQQMRKLNPSIPQDLESITIKCLEKDPNLRYENARALWEDLDRFLNGDPIKARKSTFLYYVLKKIKKNKAIFLPLSFAFFAVLILSLIWVDERISYIKKIKIMQKFGEEIKEVESIMRYSHLLPLHNNSREKSAVFEKIKKIKEKMEEIGKIGEGPGNYALGRAYFSLGDIKRAYEYYQKALDSKYEDPEFFYSYGLLLGEIYQEELKDIERIKSKEIKEAKRKRAEEKYKNGALYYMKEGKKTQKDMVRYAEALIYFYEKDYQKALEVISKLIDNSTPFYEICKLKGDIHFFSGKEKENVGDYDFAMEEYKRAEEEYLKAKEIGRSDIGIYLSRADLLRTKLKLKAQKGELDEFILKDALKEIENSQVINPENEKAYNLKSLLYWSWGNEILKYGRDPSSYLAEAISSAEKAISFRKDFPEAYTNKGISFIIKASYEKQNGLDPLESIKKAIESYQEAIKIDSQNMEPFVNAGNAYTLLVDYYISKGQEPLDFMKKAVENYKKALEIYPELPQILNNYGIIYQYKAEYEKGKGIDPRDSLKIAIEKQKKAVEINPNYPGALLNLGVNYAEIALYESSKGISPEENFRISNDYYKRALSINPNYAMALNNLASNYIELAKYKISSKENPEELFKLAEEILIQNIKIENSAYPLNDFGELYFIKGLFEIKKSKNPEVFFQKSLLYYDKALKIDSSWATPYYNKALLYLERGKFKEARGIEPLMDFNSGIKEMGRVLSINEIYYLYNETMAELFLHKAKYLYGKGKGISYLLKNAEEFIEKSIKSNPENKKIYLLKERLEEIKKGI